MLPSGPCWQGGADVVVILIQQSRFDNKLLEAMTVVEGGVPGLARAAQAGGLGLGGRSRSSW